jgi:hypothetical protein
VLNPRYWALMLDNRFWAKTSFNAQGCWIWTGARNRAGYGQITRTAIKKPYMLKTHRYTYMMTRGPIPPELELDHVRCNTPSCVNPWHMELSTHRANTLRGNTVGAIAARRTQCPQGHSYTVRREGDREVRRCLTCRKQYMKDFRRTRRAKAI